MPSSVAGSDCSQHLGLELTAVLGVRGPAAGQLEPFARVDLRQIADDGDQALLCRSHT